MVEVDEDIIIYATRYCLGRMTYVVPHMSEFLAKNANKLTGRTKAVIVVDIVRHCICAKDIYSGVPSVEMPVWAKAFEKLFKSLNSEYVDWFFNPQGGGITKEMIKQAFPGMGVLDE